MKVIATTLLGLTAALVAADGITISGAEPTGRLLADLSKQSGMSLMAAANVRDDVVLLSCKGATIDDVMGKVAKVLHAQWTKSKDQYILSRDSNLVLADQKAEIAEKVAALRSKLNEMLAGVKAQGPFTADSAKKVADNGQAFTEAFTNGSRPDPNRMKQFQENANRAPGSRAVTQILAGLSDRDLASLASGRRVVFANRPTRMQLPLAGPALIAAQAFVREQQMVVAATPPPPDNNVRRITISSFGDSQMGGGNPNDATTVMLVLNDNGPLFKASIARVTVADSKGETICSGSIALPTSPVLSKSSVATKQEEKPIQLSDLSKQFDVAMSRSLGGNAGSRRVMAFSSSMGDGKPSAPVVVSLDQNRTPPIPLSPELRKALLDPEANEPLGFSAFESFKAIADQDSESLCAYLPDGAVVPIARILANGAPKPSDMRAFAERQVGMDFALDGSWLLIQPHAPYSARDQRVSRTGLGKMLRLMDHQKSLSLADYSAYAAVQPKAPATGDFDVSYATAIDAGVTEQTLVPAQNAWQMVRFYGLLSPNQRQDFLAGQPLAVRTLTPDQLSLLVDQVYQSPDGPNPLNTGGPQGVRFFMGGQRVTDERTFTLPDGIPNNSVIRCSASPQAVIQGKDADGGIHQMSADQLAFEKWQAENPGSAPNIGGGTPPMPTAFRMTSQTNYNIQLVLGQNFGLQRSLQDTAASTGDFVSYDQLPAEVKDQVEQRLASLRQGNSFRGGPGGNGRVPPPSR